MSKSTARLHAVPEQAPRAVLYLRQSTFREESISLELQETAGRDYCERRGYDVVAVEQDPGISGRTWHRPAVQRVMAMVEAHDADVIVLWKWSRLSRSRRDWAIAADRVDVAGGRIESATEPIDTSTSTGRLARGMMTEFAAFESERIGDQWREAHERRVRMGLPANGKPRFGYRHTEAKTFEPDPVTGPALASCYRRYIGGESVYALARWLNSQGIHTVAGWGRSGGLWSDRTLRRVLDSGFAAGFITVHGELLPGAHDPLITPEEWALYQATRERRRVYRRIERSEYLLSGLMVCGLCGGHMQAGTVQPGHGHGGPRFRCRRGRELGLHPGGYVDMQIAESAVLEWLHEQADDVEEASAAEAARAARRLTARVDASTIARRITDLDTQLTRLTRQLASGLVPERAFRAARDEIATEREQLAKKLSETSETALRPAVDRAAIRALLADWDTLSVAHRRDSLRHLIRCVVAMAGRPHGTCRVEPL